jgi:thiol-disulfide isomerase/thioredoxin
LPIEGDLPDLGGATTWLDSEPLTPAGVRGKVVLVQFCTDSCVNWPRTLPYVRAWDERYRDDGLVVIGAHSPEFQFEMDSTSTRRATARSPTRGSIN